MRTRPPRVTRYGAWLLGRHLEYSTEKARTRLGWQPAIGYAESIERTLRWFLDQEASNRQKRNGSSRLRAAIDSKGTLGARLAERSCLLTGDSGRVRGWVPSTESTHRKPTWARRFVVGDAFAVGRGVQVFDPPLTTTGELFRAGARGGPDRVFNRRLANC